MKKQNTITRKAIQLKKYTRCEYNPAFLDQTHLIEKFTPLLKSIHRYFCSYFGMFDNYEDICDLYSQIQTEFLALINSYDPKRGVDFPGYIKFNLRHRIFYYVTKKQRQQHAEQLSFKSLSSDDETFVSDVEVDTSFQEKKLIIEALESIPWDKLKYDADKRLIHHILSHKTFKEIAKLEHTTYKSVSDQFDKLCEFLIQLHKSE